MMSILRGGGQLYVRNIGGIYEYGSFRIICQRTKIDVYIKMESIGLKIVVGWENFEYIS